MIWTVDDIILLSDSRHGGDGSTGKNEGPVVESVRRCFQEADSGDGYIPSPWNHFPHANLALFAAYADEARHCAYDLAERSVV
jgi:hypothetical protein